ncbi:hypothetical protein [Micromonospora sp. NPDC005806]|uniref:hypothetical protein n=1 Tax=Micromonospora sp. NPDC005806 TaxID=3364234 RepID=UPI0036965F1D
MKRWVARLAVGMAAMTAATVGVAAPAQAYPVTPYPNVCWQKQSAGSPCYLWTNGTVTWYNRTASVAGAIASTYHFCYGHPFDRPEAVFEAYAGATKIDSHVVSIMCDTLFTFSDSFGFDPFGIGDTNLVGGINRIKITMCYKTSFGRSCGDPYNANKPS